MPRVIQQAPLLLFYSGLHRARPADTSVRSLLAVRADRRGASSDRATSVSNALMHRSLVVEGPRAGKRRRVLVIRILQWPIILEVSLLVVKEVLEHLLVPDRIVPPFLHLALLDLTQVSDSPDFSSCL